MNTKQKQEKGQELVEQVELNKAILQILKKKKVLSLTKFD